MSLKMVSQSLVTSELDLIKSLAHVDKY